MQEGLIVLINVVVMGVVGAIAAAVLLGVIALRERLELCIKLLKCVPSTDQAGTLLLRGDTPHVELPTGRLLQAFVTLVRRLLCLVRLSVA